MGGRGAERSASRGGEGTDGARNVQRRARRGRERDLIIDGVVLARTQRRCADGEGVAAATDGKSGRVNVVCHCGSR